MNILGIIPARYASVRFPGKPLAILCGKPMIQHVYENASKAGGLNDLAVATDDRRIYDAVTAFSGKAVLTSNRHPNGTSRCLEAVRQLEKTNRLHYDVVINIQGDEPFINPQQIEKVVSLFNRPEVEIGTLAKKITRNEELFSPHVVKVVSEKSGKALYFSRQAIPYVRNRPQEKWLNHADYYKHIGLYGYRRQTLESIVALPPGKAEEAEKLEQLRWLEQGYSIYISITEIESTGVDTPEDLSKLTNNPC